MKKISFIIILTSFMIPSFAVAEPNHGPVIKAFYAPFGAGAFNVPYDKTINGGTDASLTSDSGSSGNSLKTLSGYSLSCGYFYDRFQGDISYTGMETENLYVVNNSTPGHLYYSDASYWNVDVKGGYRFNDPGDTSYKWLYLGIRKMNLEIPYNNTESEAIGILGGFYGFSSFGLSGPFEFVMTYDIYAGTCRYNDNNLRTDVSIDINRKFAVDLGLSAGMGIQYEPWDLAAVIKISPFMSERIYKQEITGNNKGTAASLRGTLIGIEIIFSIPEYKNNIVK